MSPNQPLRELPIWHDLMSKVLRCRMLDVTRSQFHSTESRNQSMGCLECWLQSATSYRVAKITDFYILTRKICHDNLLMGWTTLLVARQVYLRLHSKQKSIQSDKGNAPEHGEAGLLAGNISQMWLLFSVTASQILMYKAKVISKGRLFRTSG